MIIDIINNVIINILAFFIIKYGSVYETQYPDYIYLYGDEKIVILLLMFICYYTTMYYDYTIGLLLFISIFFITNDLPIIQRHISKITKHTNDKKEYFNNVMEPNMYDMMNALDINATMEKNVKYLTGKLNAELSALNKII